jgi:MFS superfamily sulfate permease-like transporter
MASKDDPPGPGRVARWVPIASWLPRYQRGWLAGDAIAGFTIWGLLIPEMIAYASLAGLPPQAGLYTLGRAGLLGRDGPGAQGRG